MSNQGNIEVWAWPPSTTNHENTGLFRFTTSRWGGDMTPAAVRRALRECYSEDREDIAYDPHEFLGALMHDPDVRFPLADFGNTDTPTVVVNFATQGVFFRREYTDPTAPERDKRMGRWSFEQFVALDFAKEPLIAEWYENLYHVAKSGQDLENHACGMCGCHLGRK